jgi:hypothetical protein
VSIRFATLLEGRELGAPLCCVLRYTLEEALNPDAEQCVQRGVRFKRNGDEYVPCLILHQAAVTHAELNELLSLLGGTIHTRALERNGMTP